MSYGGGYHRSRYPDSRYRYSEEESEGESRRRYRTEDEYYREEDRYHRARRPRREDDYDTSYRRQSYQQQQQQQQPQALPPHQPSSEKPQRRVVEVDEPKKIEFTSEQLKIIEEIKRKAAEEAKKMFLSSTPIAAAAATTLPTQPAEREVQAADTEMLETSGSSSSTTWPTIAEVVARSVRENKAMSPPRHKIPERKKIEEESAGWSTQMSDEDRESRRGEESFEPARRRFPRRQSPTLVIRRDRSFRHSPPRIGRRQNRNQEIEDTLRTAIRDRPPGHPTDRDLLRLEIGQELRGGQYDEYVYRRLKKTGEVREDFIVMAETHHHCERRRPEDGNLLHGYSRIWPMADITDKTELPVPSSQMPGDLLKYRQLFSLEKKTVNCQHYDYGHGCYCAPTTLAAHPQLHVPNVCFKRDRCDRESMIIKFAGQEPTTQPNPHQAYASCRDEERAVLTVPNPFFLNYKWSNKPYLAAHSKEGPTTKQDLFYTLHQESTYRSIYTPYLRCEPDRWSQEEHPLFKEPSQSDELAEYTRSLYGVESLGRVMPMHHPLKEEKILVISATTAEFETPILYTNGEISKLDSFLKHRLQPFITKGWGSIMCSVCVFQIYRDGSVKEAVYTRLAYIHHFRTEHLPHLPAMAFGFTTAYHTRLYMAHAVYLMLYACLPDKPQDEPDFPALAVLHHLRYKTETSTCLQTFLMEKGQASTIQKAVKNHSFGIVYTAEEKERIKARRGMQKTVGTSSQSRYHDISESEDESENAAGYNPTRPEYEPRQQQQQKSPTPPPAKSKTPTPEATRSRSTTPFEDYTEEQLRSSEKIIRMLAD